MKNTEVYCRFLIIDIMIIDMTRCSKLYWIYSWMEFILKCHFSRYYSVCSNSADKQNTIQRMSELAVLVSTRIYFDLGRCQTLILFDFFEECCATISVTVTNATFNKEQNATNPKSLRHPVQKLRLNQCIHVFGDLDLDLWHIPILQIFL